MQQMLAAGMLTVGVHEAGMHKQDAQRRDKCSGGAQTGMQKAGVHRDAQLGCTSRDAQSMDAKSRVHTAGVLIAEMNALGAKHSCTCISAHW